jgi:hypothetical protein
MNCNIKSKSLCGKLWCEICFNRCFMSHEKSLNILTNINTLLIFKCSTLKFEFLCNTCMHSFIKSPNEIINDNTWCPYCSKPPKKLCDIESCKNLF